MKIWACVHTLGASTQRLYTFSEVPLGPDEDPNRPRGDAVLTTAREALEGGSGKWHDLIYVLRRDWCGHWVETRTTGVGAIRQAGREVPTAVCPGDGGGLDGGISSSSEARKDLPDSAQIWRWSRQDLSDWTWSVRPRGGSGDTGLLIWGREQEGGVGLVEEAEGRRRWRGSAFNPSWLPRPFTQFMRFSRTCTGVVCHSLLQWAEVCYSLLPRAEGEEGVRRWEGWTASLMQQSWIWANPGR